jgi:imidazolonepropionase-like amidohydrolase
MEQIDVCKIPTTHCLIMLNINTMYKSLNTAIVLIACSITSLCAQMVKPSEYGSFLLKGGTIHNMVSEAFTADLLITNGIIVEVKTSISSAEGAKVINCTGKHLYPGFIDGGTQVGLSEIQNLNVTNDFDEIGEVLPHMEALTAVNPNAVTIPVTRVNGVTTVIASPKGDLFCGTAALINLHGYTPDHMYAGFKGVVLTFPEQKKTATNDRQREDDKREYTRAINKLNEVWHEAKLYAKIDSSITKNDVTIKTKIYKPELEALKNVLHQKLPLLIEVNKEKDILEAIKWIKENNVKAILTGVAEGYRVATDIAVAGLPVIVGSLQSRPMRAYDKYDAGYTNAGKLHKAGVLVALKTDEAENARNLPFHAGFAAAYGMGKEEALKAITINPAKIFGLEKLYGSLEKDKIANIIVADGDPFEMKTRILYLFINGWSVPLESRQTLLYEEFLKRNPGLK